MKVKVKFTDSSYNYHTSVKDELTNKEIREYFIGTPFNMGVYPKELMLECVEVEISRTDSQGRTYVQTSFGRMYDPIDPKKLFDDGFHTYANKQTK